MSKTAARTAEKSEAHEQDRARKEEKTAAARERDDKLKEINTRYEAEVATLRTKAHEERQKIWNSWRERRNES